MQILLLDFGNTNLLVCNFQIRLKQHFGWRALPSSSFKLNNPPAGTMRREQTRAAEGVFYSRSLHRGTYLPCYLHLPLSVK